MREAVAHEAQPALLDVLLDRVRALLLRDLRRVSAARRPAAPPPRTSYLPLVQRGTSTTMLSSVFCAFAYSGMSWNGDTGAPACSMKMRWSVRVQHSPNGTPPSAPRRRAHLACLAARRGAWCRRARPPPDSRGVAQSVHSWVSAAGPDWGGGTRLTSALRAAGELLGDWVGIWARMRGVDWNASVDAAARRGSRCNNMHMFLSDTVLG